MTRSDAYVVLGPAFARDVEQDRTLWAVALTTAERRGDTFKVAALRALGVTQ